MKDPEFTEFVLYGQKFSKQEIITLKKALVRSMEKPKTTSKETSDEATRLKKRISLLEKDIMALHNIIKDLVDRLSDLEYYVVAKEGAMGIPKSPESSAKDE